MLLVVVPGTSTSTGRFVFAEMNDGSTTRAAKRIAGQFARTHSAACHSSMTLAAPTGICTRRSEPLVTSKTICSQAAPPCGRSRLRMWLSTRCPASRSSIVQATSGPSKASSIVAAESRWLVNPGPFPTTSTTPAKPMTARKNTRKSSGDCGTKATGIKTISGMENQ